MGMPPMFLTIFLENVFCGLDLRTHNLENRISSWSNYGSISVSFGSNPGVINFATFSMAAVVRP